MLANSFSISHTPAAAASVTSPLVADAYTVTIGDIDISEGIIVSLHEHPLQILRRADLQTISVEKVFGLAGSTVCQKCSSLTYDVCAMCPNAACDFRVCLSCYDKYQKEQREMLLEVLDKRHGAGSMAHRVREQRAKRIRTAATVHENRQLPLIFSACVRGDLNSLKETIDKSCFSDTLDLEEPCEVGEYKGATLLVIAAKLGLGDITDLLISRGASCEAIDTRGMTPLMHAAFSGHADVVDKLIFAKASVDKVAICGYTALLFAANRGHTLCVERLLAGGAKRTVRNPSGRTVLMIAALNGHLSTVRFLLTRVPPHEIMTLRDNEGYTALGAAVAARHTAIEKLILEVYKANT